MSINKVAILRAGFFQSELFKIALIGRMKAGLQKDHFFYGHVNRLIIRSIVKLRRIDKKRGMKSLYTKRTFNHNNEKISIYATQP